MRKPSNRIQLKVILQSLNTFLQKLLLRPPLRRLLKMGKLLPRMTLPNLLASQSRLQPLLKSLFRCNLALRRKQVGLRRRVAAKRMIQHSSRSSHHLKKNWKHLMNLRWRKKNMMKRRRKMNDSRL